VEHDGDTRDDAALLRAAVGDPAAFARFYRRHVRGVIAFFHRRTGDAETAADLTAETFAAALEGCHRYAPDRGAPAAWLYGIAHRQLATLQRSGGVERRARRRLGMARIDLTDEMLERVEAIADAERVDVAVAMRLLPGDQRDAVRARVLHDRSYAEIAAAQRISAPAARQRVSRGLAALRAHLKGIAP
jgi:RNA polymerase sigma-70 factor (ECF subfamily)